MVRSKGMVPSRVAASLLLVVLIGAGWAAELSNSEEGGAQHESGVIPLATAEEEEAEDLAAMQATSLKAAHAKVAEAKNVHSIAPTEASQQAIIEAHATMNSTMASLAASSTAVVESVSNATNATYADLLAENAALKKQVASLLLAQQQGQQLLQNMTQPVAGNVSAMLTVANVSSDVTNVAAQIVENATANDATIVNATMATVADATSAAPMGINASQAAEQIAAQATQLASAASAANLATSVAQGEAARVKQELTDATAATVAASAALNASIQAAAEAEAQVGAFASFLESGATNVTRVTEEFEARLGTPSHSNVTQVSLDVSEAETSQLQSEVQEEEAQLENAIVNDVNSNHMLGERNVVNVTAMIANERAEVQRKAESYATLQFGLRTEITAAEDSIQTARLRLVSVGSLPESEQEAARQEAEQAVSAGQTMLDSKNAELAELLSSIHQDAAATAAALNATMSSLESVVARANEQVQSAESALEAANEAESQLVVEERGARLLAHEANMTYTSALAQQDAFANATANGTAVLNSTTQLEALLVAAGNSSTVSMVLNGSTSLTAQPDMSTAPNKTNASSILANPAAIIPGQGSNATAADAAAAVAAVQSELLHGDHSDAEKAALRALLDIVQNEAEAAQPMPTDTSNATDSSNVTQNEAEAAQPTPTDTSNATDSSNVTQNEAEAAQPTPTDPSNATDSSIDQPNVTAATDSAHVSQLQVRKADADAGVVAIQSQLQAHLESSEDETQALQGLLTAAQKEAADVEAQISALSDAPNTDEVQALDT
jgi:hypothetical protein